ncbi:protein of unknown function [Azospirillum baldaniorum]|uniref:Uncharacterized protein n=1 Tax=Azospirillum baldaniorum TaxID=1064539 RepID=A0A9P1JP64_9PROT|nr:protein of unknown function [Azospirillum baldaniorum]
MRHLLGLTGILEFLFKINKMKST